MQEEIIEIDPLLVNVVEFAIERNEISVSMIQRKFKIGYSRGVRIIDQMEELKIITSYISSKPRKVIINLEDWKELREKLKDKTSVTISKDTGKIQDIGLEEKISIAENNLCRLFVEILKYKNVDASADSDDLFTLKVLVLKHYPQYSDNILFLDSRLSPYTTKEWELELLESTYTYISKTYKIPYTPPNEPEDFEEDYESGYEEAEEEKEQNKPSLTDILNKYK